MGKELDMSTSNLWRIPYPAAATPDGLYNLLLDTAPSPDHPATSTTCSWAQDRALTIQLYSTVTSHMLPTPPLAKSC